MSQVGAGAAARAALSTRADSGRVGHDWLGSLAEVPLFEGLSKRHLQRIAKLARIRRFASGAPLVRSGDAGQTFYVLLDGSARVVRAGGRVRRLGVGDYFGEMALLDGAPRSADVIADGEVLALTIDRAGFAKLLRSEPALTQALLRTLASRLRAAERSLYA
ncbi:MAG TPA: cyclic nucleotide-binding domain-containing protein [Gaiellaceae bacterium]|nr:cyclic nucleotide-binding domain-containing protein [Gaiellaceae bacterium]